MALTPQGQHLLFQKLPANGLPFGQFLGALLQCYASQPLSIEPIGSCPNATSG